MPGFLTGCFRLLQGLPSALRSDIAASIRGHGLLAKPDGVREVTWSSPFSRATPPASLAHCGPSSSPLPRYPAKDVCEKSTFLTAAPARLEARDLLSAVGNEQTPRRPQPPGGGAPRPTRAGILAPGFYASLMI